MLFFKKSSHVGWWVGLFVWCGCWWSHRSRLKVVSSMASVKNSLTNSSWFSVSLLSSQLWVDFDTIMPLWFRTEDLFYLMCAKHHVNDYNSFHFVFVVSFRGLIFIWHGIEDNIEQFSVTPAGTQASLRDSGSNGVILSLSIYAPQISSATFYFHLQVSALWNIHELVVNLSFYSFKICRCNLKCWDIFDHIVWDQTKCTDLQLVFHQISFH